MKSIILHFRISEEDIASIKKSRNVPIQKILEQLLLDAIKSLLQNGVEGEILLEVD